MWTVWKDMWIEWWFEERHARSYWWKTLQVWTVWKDIWTDRIFEEIHDTVINTGEKSYKCEQCGKTVKLKSDLKVHIRIHTCDSYWCKLRLYDWCWRTFNQDRTNPGRNKDWGRTNYNKEKNNPGRYKYWGRPNYN